MNQGKEQILFYRADFERFKKAYAAEKAKGADDHATLIFDGNEWVMGYAKYAIEYLEDKFQRKS